MPPVEFRDLLERDTSRIDTRHCRRTGCVFWVRQRFLATSPARSREAEQQRRPFEYLGGVPSCSALRERGPLRRIRTTDARIFCRTLGQQDSRFLWAMMERVMWPSFFTTNWLRRRRLQQAAWCRAVECLEQRQVLSGQKFDFGTSSSPVESGFTRVPVVAYSAARGWGWDSTSGLSATDRRTGDVDAPDLTRDFHSGRDKTFRVNVANGVYDVVLQLGDASSRHDQIRVEIEGTSVATGIDTARGQFFRATYRTTVLDGELNVRLIDSGGVNKFWAINGLEVRPLATSETLATVALTSGWATFGQALPKGAAFEALQIGSLPTQTDIKTRWDDGSIRFAILTADVPTGGSYAITPVFSSVGNVELGELPAEVRFTTGLLDQPSAIAAIPSGVLPDSLWLGGSAVHEGRWAVVPTDSNGQPLSGLRVLFDQRTYRDGARRLEVTIENSDDTADNQLRNLI